MKYFKIEIWKDDAVTTFILTAPDRRTASAVSCKGYPYHEFLYITELEV